MKVVLITQSDHANSGYSYYEAIKTYTDIDVRQYDRNEIAAKISAKFPL